MGKRRRKQVKDTGSSPDKEHECQRWWLNWLVTVNKVGVIWAKRKKIKASSHWNKGAVEGGDGGEEDLELVK